MDFLKRHWSTLVLIGVFGAYLGFSLGSDRCPLCVASNLLSGKNENVPIVRKAAEVLGQQEPSSWRVNRIDGRELNSEGCKGKVAVIVYWATWCAPCRKEVPALIALRSAFPKDELDIIGVSLDQNSKSIDYFITSNRINYDIARNNDSLDKAFGPIRYIPTTLILDRRGIVQQRYTGIVAPHVLRGQVEALLEDKA